MTVTKRRSTAQIAVSNRIPSRRTALAGAVSLALASSAAMAAYPTNIEPYGKLASEVSSAGVEAVLPLVQSNGSLFFVDGKAAIGTDDFWKINVGLAYRQQTSDKQWQWGVYGAYDYQNSENDNGFGGLTFGGEVRSERWDFRANYYYPLDDEELYRTTRDVAKQPFRGNWMYVEGIYDEAMEGFDLEVGARIDAFSTVQTRAFLKGFWYEGDVVPDNNGWQASLELRPQKNVIIEAGYRNDDMFDSQGFLQVKYAFGQPSDKGNLTLDERMVEPWRREDSVIWAGHQSTDANWAVKAQEFGSLVHIDSERAPLTGADGTYERPYASTEDCLANNCPLPVAETVLLWQGNSEQNPYGPFTLRPGQTLWGQGVDLAALEGFSGLAGQMPISFNPLNPLYPVIDPNGGEGVVLAPNSTVAGVAIAGGVMDSMSGMNGSSVLPEYITGSGDGIVGEFGAKSQWADDGYADGGQIVLYANKIAVSGDGIVVSDYNNGASTTKLDIIQNTIRAGKYGIDLYNAASGYGNSSTQIVLIEGNEIVAYYTGVALFNSSYAGGIATQDVTISGNTITAGDVGIGLRNVAKYSYYVGPEMAAAITPSDVTAGSFYATQTVQIQDNSITATGRYYSGGTGIFFANSGKYEFSAPGAAAAVASLDDGEGLVVNGLAGQFVTIEGNTIVAGNAEANSDARYYSGGAAIVGYNTGKYGRGRPIVLQADNGTIYADAYQQISISGNTIRAGEERTGYVDGGEGVTYYDGGEGIALFNAGYLGGDALQVALIDNNDIMAGRSGIVAINTDVGNDTFITNTAEQQLTITDNTVTVGYYVGSSGGSALQLYNVAKYGGHAEQVVDVSGNSLTVYEGGIGILNYAHVDTYYDDIVSLANQTVTLTGNTIESWGHPDMVDNPAKYAAVFAANYAGSGLAGDANQYLTLTGNSISTDSGGVTLGNLAEADDTYYVASTAVAYQSASLTNNTIVSTGFGVGIANVAQDGADANQEVAISGGSITVGDADWIGIDDGEVAGGVAAFNIDNGFLDPGTAIQNVTVSGVDIQTTTAGISLFNLVENDGSATQTASLTGNTIDAVEYGIYAQNGGDLDTDFGGTYGGGTGTPTQLITIGANVITVTGDSAYGIALYNTSDFVGQVATQTVTAATDVGASSITVTGEGGDGIHMENYAYYGDAQQHVTLANLTIDATALYGRGVEMYNTAENNSTATQSLTINGGSIEADLEGVLADNGANYYGYGSGSSATQEITLSGVSVTSANEDAVQLNNGAFETDSEATQTFTANNAGSTLAVSINGGADGIDASNTAYGYYSQASQTIALSGVSVTGAEGQGLDLDNETYYTAGFSVATQTVTVGQGSAASPVSISGYEEGIAGSNDANGYYSQATQSITLTGVSVTSEIEDAVGMDNWADGEDSTANSTFIATNTGTTALNISGYWDGVDAQNTAAYGYYAQATQTITLSGMSVTGSYGQGLDLDNDAISDFSVATQTVTVGNGNVQDALGNPLRVSISGETGIQAVNDADDYYAQAVQSVVLSGASITGTANDGVEMRNVADSTGAVADQKVNVGDAVIDGYEGGVVMVNDGDASDVANASQKFNQEGGTINSGTGYFAVNATNEGWFAAQNVAVSGVIANVDGTGLGVQLISDGADTDSVQGLNLNTGTLYSDGIGVVVSHTGGTQIASIANQTLVAEGSYAVEATGGNVTDQKTIANTTTVNKPYRNSGSGYMLVDITEVPPGTTYDPNP